MCIGLQVKCLLLFSDINETWVFWKNFGKIFKYQTSWKIRLLEAELFHAGRRKDGYRKDEANSPFSQIFESAKKKKLKPFFCGIVWHNFSLKYIQCRENSLLPLCFGVIRHMLHGRLRINGLFCGFVWQIYVTI
jgi:hypothetical protein